MDAPPPSASQAIIQELYTLAFSYEIVLNFKKKKKKSFFKDRFISLQQCSKYAVFRTKKN